MQLEEANAHRLVRKPGKRESARSRSNTDDRGQSEASADPAGSPLDRLRSTEMLRRLPLLGRLILKHM